MEVSSYHHAHGSRYIAHQRAENAPEHTFSFRLWSLMKKYQLTSYAVARDSGLGESFISRLLSGEREPSYETLIKIASAIPATRGEKQWLFITQHFIIPEWEEAINAFTHTDVPTSLPLDTSPVAHG